MTTATAPTARSTPVMTVRDVHDTLFDTRATVECTACTYRKVLCVEAVPTVLAVHACAGYDLRR